LLAHRDLIYKNLLYFGSPHFHISVIGYGVPQEFFGHF